VTSCCAWASSPAASTAPSWPGSRATTGGMPTAPIPSTWAWWTGHGTGRGSGSRSAWGCSPCACC